jgi:hypothetical protein
MKKLIIRISAAMALLMLTPYVGSNIVKADDTTDNVVNDVPKAGSVVGTMQMSADVTVYYVQDDQSGSVYPYTGGSAAFNINDKVQFTLCYSSSGKILIKSIIRK